MKPPRHDEIETRPVAAPRKRQVAVQSPPDRVASDIGRRLTAVRKDARLTQDELSRVSDFSLAAIKNYERGARRPTTDYVMFLAERYRVSADWLLLGRGERYVEASAPGSEPPEGR